MYDDTNRTHDTYAALLGFLIGSILRQVFFYQRPNFKLTWCVLPLYDATNWTPNMDPALLFEKQDVMLPGLISEEDLLAMEEEKATIPPNEWIEI